MGSDIAPDTAGPMRAPTPQLTPSIDTPNAWFESFDASETTVLSTPLIPGGDESYTGNCKLPSKVISLAYITGKKKWI